MKIFAKTGFFAVSNRIKFRYNFNMNMEVFVLGCGGMMPLPHRHLTSVLLRRDGDLFLFDCGEGTQVSLKRLNLKWKKIDAIFISHTHADHVTGLPGIMMLSSQVDRTEPLYIYGPPKIAEYVESSRKVLDMYINYPVIVKEITAPCVVHEGNGFYIRAFPLQHTKTCVGYTLEELDRPGEFNPEVARSLKIPIGPLWRRSNGIPRRRFGRKAQWAKIQFCNGYNLFANDCKRSAGERPFDLRGNVCRRTCRPSARKKTHDGASGGNDCTRRKRKKHGDDSLQPALQRPRTCNSFGASATSLSKRKTFARPHDF